MNLDPGFRNLNNQITDQFLPVPARAGEQSERKPSAPRGHQPETGKRSRRMETYSFLLRSSNETGHRSGCSHTFIIVGTPISCYTK